MGNAVSLWNRCGRDAGESKTEGITRYHFLAQDRHVKGPERFDSHRPLSSVGIGYAHDPACQQDPSVRQQRGGMLGAPYF